MTFSFSPYFLIENNLETKLFQALIAFDLSFFPCPWTREGWEKIIELKQDVFLLIVHQGDELIGFSLWELDRVDRLAHLQKIVIKPESRQQKMAETLLEKSEQTLLTIGVERLFLEVAEGNLAAVNFYYKHRFILLTKKRSYYSSGDNALVMEKLLKPKS